MTRFSSSSSSYDVLVIGGGLVGLATALAFQKDAGLRLALIETEDRLAAHQTGRNSGVIHSGLYYRPGSLKAQNCTEGREALYRFCQEHGIAHERCGKVVIALDRDEAHRLEQLEQRGRENGLDGVRKLSVEELKEREPHAGGVAGLFVPQTGIVDFVQVAETMADLIRAGGGEIHLATRFEGLHRDGGGWKVETSRGGLSARNLVNCGGLYSDRIARRCGVDPGLQIVPFRGEYYEIRPERCSLVHNLIYPTPDPRFPFLGVHLTRMIHGGVEAGPNAVLALKREGYRKLDFSFRDAGEFVRFRGFRRMALRHWAVGLSETYRSFSKRAFVQSVQKLLPVIQSSDLQPGGAGVRAQAVEPDGQLCDDFRIIGADRMIHVLNAPSPAATACLSIGRRIVEKAKTHFDLNGLNG